jgi:hypothetical protein
LTDTNISIAPATEADLSLVLSFIKALAQYERLSHQVIATEESLHKTLFGPEKYAEALIAKYGSEPAGCALFFHNVSTFLGKPGIYAEDISSFQNSTRERSAGRYSLLSPGSPLNAGVAGFNGPCSTGTSRR